METASITEVKNGLSAIIDRVKAGESIVVTDRGVPVAVIEPISARVDVDDRLTRLERAGIIKRGTGKPPIELIRIPGPKLGDGNTLVEAVLEERRSGGEVLGHLHHRPPVRGRGRHPGSDRGVRERSLDGRLVEHGRRVRLGYRTPRA